MSNVESIYSKRLDLVSDQALLEELAKRERLLLILSDRLLLGELLCGEADPKMFLERVLKEDFV